MDFNRHIALLDAATNQVVALVGMLRTLGAGKIHQAKELNGKLQQIEGDAQSGKLGEVYQRFDPENPLASPGG